MAHVLIVDDERPLCALVRALLGEHGHSATCAYSGEDALQAFSGQRYDLVLLDLNLNLNLNFDGMDGIETLRRFRAIDAVVPIVIITAFGSIGSAVEAMKRGATDFISKPFHNQALVANVEKLLDMRCQASTDGPALVGESTVFRQALDSATRFAVPDINLLLLGETGTGKELFARAIHAASKRCDGPFVPVDCAMLAENLIESELFGHEKGAFTGATNAHVGRFELAQGGTMLLDEIGNLSLAMQAKLLRVLQERRIERVGGRESIHLDVRIVSATNADLRAAVRAGHFRQDLFYRLKEMTIELPPLRFRHGDIRALAEHFVDCYARRFGASTRGISDSALVVLEGHHWPGNVRELQNAIKSAIILSSGTSELILPEHLPLDFADGAMSVNAGISVSCRMTAPDAADAAQPPQLANAGDVAPREVDLKSVGAHAAELAERSVLQELLRRGHLSTAELARQVGVDPKTLRTKLRRYGLEGGLATPADR